jgi:hypothetical protein
MVISGCESVSTVRPRWQQRQTRAEEGGLELVESAVDTGLNVTTPIALSSIAQPPYPSSLP